VTTTKPTLTEDLVELAPSLKIPLVLIFTGIALFFFQFWLSLIIFFFGLFLLFQALTLRLQFTKTALDIYRQQNLIRRFPYSDWLNWRIFWAKVPILFYFKEVNSIHFLPILFSPTTLETCLEKYCPRK
jgi:hypothetical protein